MYTYIYYHILSTILIVLSLLVCPVLLVKPCETSPACPMEKRLLRIFAEEALVRRSAAEQLQKERGTDESRWPMSSRLTLCGSVWPQ